MPFSRLTRSSFAASKNSSGAFARQQNKVAALGVFLAPASCRPSSVRPGKARKSLTRRSLCLLSPTASSVACHHEEVCPRAFTRVNNEGSAFGFASPGSTLRLLRWPVLSSLGLREASRHLIYFTHSAGDALSNCQTTWSWRTRPIVLRCVGRVARIRNSGSRALTVLGACATVIFLRDFQLLRATSWCAPRF